MSFSNSFSFVLLRLILIRLYFALSDDIPIQNDPSSTSHSQSIQSGSLQSQQLGCISEEQEAENTKSKETQKGKDGQPPKVHKAAFGGLKKLIDREKDKGDKELTKAANAIKSGINDTKENVRKLMGKGDKQSSKMSIQLSTTEDISLVINNGDLKNSLNSPLPLTKRSNDALKDESIDISIITDKTLPDVVSNGNGHGIISPFESLHEDESDTDDALNEQHSQILPPTATILMDNASNKIMGNVQVSQV